MPSRSISPCAGDAVTAAVPHPVARAVSHTLHALLAVAIVHQVVTGLFLGPPRSPVARLHDIGGLVSLGLLVAFWLWSLVRRDGALLLDYLPWLSVRRQRAVAADIGIYLRHALSLRIPPHGRCVALPAAFHGLGLLTASAMAATGAYAYFAAGPALFHPPDVHRAHLLHVRLADVMWAYLVLHAAAAALHGIVGLRRTRVRSP